jgi:AcrR family transcriptional regulator
MKSSVLTSPSAQKDEELIQRALAATILCIEAHGLHKISMDHIAAESGISRATLYRRFGNKEGILTALCQQQAIPYTQNAMLRTATANSLAERLEIGTVYAVMELPQYQILKTVFSDGPSEFALNLVRPVYRHLVQTNLMPILEIAREAGELRSGLDPDEVSEWLLRNFLQLVATGPWEEDTLLRRIRQFILPVLIPDQLLTATAQEPSEQHELMPNSKARLDKLEQQLQQLLQQQAQYEMQSD